MEDQNEAQENKRSIISVVTSAIKYATFILMMMMMKRLEVFAEATEEFKLGRKFSYKVFLVLDIITFFTSQVIGDANVFVNRSSPESIMKIVTITYKIMVLVILLMITTIVAAILAIFV